jgi:hypothetical protein
MNIIYINGTINDDQLDQMDEVQFLNGSMKKNLKGF